MPPVTDEFAPVVLLLLPVSPARLARVFPVLPAFELEPSSSYILPVVESYLTFCGFGLVVLSKNRYN